MTMTIDEMWDACQTINEARQLLNKTKIVPKSPDLKVYCARASWDGQTSPNIEITILAITKQTAEDKVREILDDGGYDTG